MHANRYSRHAIAALGLCVLATALRGAGSADGPRLVGADAVPVVTPVGSDATTAATIPPAETGAENVVRARVARPSVVAHGAAADSLADSRSPAVAF